jgi:hypothetical protein
VEQLGVESGTDFAGEDQIIVVEVANQQGTGPTRAPCGSVNPPTTNSCAASHFILSHCGDRRCS